MCKVCASLFICQYITIGGEHGWWKLIDPGDQFHPCRVDLKAKGWAFHLFLIPLPEKAADTCFVRGFIRAEAGITVDTHEYTSTIGARIIADAIGEHL